MTKQEILKSMSKEQKNKFRQLYAEEYNKPGYGLMDNFKNIVQSLLRQSGVEVTSLKESTANAIVDKLTY